MHYFDRGVICNLTMCQIKGQCVSKIFDFFLNLKFCSWMTNRCLHNDSKLQQTDHKISILIVFTLIVARKMNEDE